MPYEQFTFGMDKISVQVLVLLLCLAMESAGSDKTYTAQESQNPKENQRKNDTDIVFPEESHLNTKVHKIKPCLDCHNNKLLHSSKDDKTNSTTREASTASQPDSNDSPTNIIFPVESERIEFSRKYNPDLTSNDDGFMPVPGPYGRKTRLSVVNAPSLKSPSVNTYKSESTPRNANGGGRSPQDISHSQRYSPHVKRHQDVQRRSQYRVPKAHEKLAVKESIRNDNILGNGNFEIIRGGIYTDQDANEILGSRRMGRGYGSYVIPSYRQNRHVVQNVRFPPFYQGRIQNPLQPLYYPRAPY